VGLWPFRRSERERAADDDAAARPDEDEAPSGVVAWWFAREAQCAGSVERYDGVPEVGRAGLHAADSPLSALEHAKSAYLCRVVLDGELVEAGTQRAATYRRVLFTRAPAPPTRPTARSRAVPARHPG